MDKDSFERLREQRRIKAEKIVKYRNFIENLMNNILDDPIKMPPNNPGYDWSFKNRQKIDNKSRCISHSNKTQNWLFHIRRNNIADWFILYGWDDDLKPLHIWVFHKNDIVRNRKFSEFDTFSITNDKERLIELEKYEYTNRLDRLKEILKEILKERLKERLKEKLE